MAYTYDPNQPREPAGSPIGGRWTKEQGAAYENPSKDLLDRSAAVFHEFTDGKVSKYIYKQMYGSVIDKQGRALPMTEGQKNANLARIKEELDYLRSKDPEAFDWSIRMSLADEARKYGVGDGTWNSIPEIVNVYRGDSPGAKLPRMTNVSLSREVAASFGKLFHFQISKYDIGYVNYASSFAEGELFIFDTRRLIPVDPVIFAARKGAGLE